MVFKWRDNQTEEFVNLYREYECLWNIGNKLYKNRDAREAAYSRMCERLNLPELNVYDVKNKIKTVRTTYKLELNRILKAKRRGVSYVPQLFWFKTADTFLRSVSIARINTLKTEAGEEVENQETADDNETEISKADADPWGNCETTEFVTTEATENQGQDNTYLLVVHSEVPDGTPVEEHQIQTDDAPAPDASRKSTFPRVKLRPLVKKSTTPVKLDVLNSSKGTNESVKRKENGDVKVVVPRPKSSSQLFGDYLVSKLETYSDYVRNVVQHEINEIIFQADMGSYDVRTFQPHVVAVSNT